MKPSRGVTLAAALLLAASPPYTAKQDTLAPPHPKSDLPVSLGRTLAENQCESEGIQRIIEFMKSSDFEIMWVYIPDAGSPEMCQWIEIGRAKHGSGTAEAIIDVDRVYLAKLMAEHTTLHLYHSHPLVYFEPCRDTKNCSHLSVPMTTESISEKGLIANVRYSMPSPDDIVFMMDVTRGFSQHHGHGKHIKNRVVTPYGIVEYCLTKEGERRLQEVGMEGKEGRWGFDTYIRTRLSYGLTDDDIRAIVHKNSDDITQALEQLAQSLNNRYLRLTYHPF